MIFFHFYNEVLNNFVPFLYETNTMHISEIISKKQKVPNFRKVEITVVLRKNFKFYFKFCLRSHK